MLNTDPMRRRLALGAGLITLILVASACASGSASSAPAATQTTAESTAASTVPAASVIIWLIVASDRMSKSSTMPCDARMAR